MSVIKWLTYRAMKPEVREMFETLCDNERCAHDLWAHVPTKQNPQWDCDECWKPWQVGPRCSGFRPPAAMLEGPGKALWLDTEADLLRKAGAVVDKCHCGTWVIGGLSDGRCCFECNCLWHDHRTDRRIMFISHRQRPRERCVHCIAAGRVRA